MLAKSSTTDSSSQLPHSQVSPSSRYTLLHLEVVIITYTTIVPLTDDKIFEIRIDRKVESWSGSLEVGVTTADPQTLTSSSEDGGGFPSSANELSQGSSWIMSGNTVRRDGKSVHENYGQLDLDQVNEQVRTTEAFRTGSR